MKTIIMNLKALKRMLIDYSSFLAFFAIKLKYKVSSVEPEIEGQDVSVVITSCGRPDLLSATLDTFFKFNTHPISRYILVEDAGCQKCVSVFLKKTDKLDSQVIFHERNVGQLKSIDEAYARVQTKFIFHIEDDWCFVRPGFIEYSKKCFLELKGICSVSIRPHRDWNFSTGQIELQDDYYLVRRPRNFVWDGIAINPGLYDTAKYWRIAPYSQYGKERKIALMYRMVGYRAVLSDAPEGYVIHAGDGRTTRKDYKVA